MKARIQRSVYSYQAGNVRRNSWESGVGPGRIDAIKDTERWVVRYSLIPSSSTTLANLPSLIQRNGDLKIRIARALFSFVGGK